MDEQSPKILIVEDTEQLQELYKMKLTAEKFTVFTATSGDTALKIIKEHHPDLILLDIMIVGDMNGFDLLEVVKRDESIKDIPVIVLTNLNSEDVVAKELGVVDYLVKVSTDLNVLVSKVKQHLPQK